MLNTILLVIIILLLLHINFKLPGRNSRDYVAEAMDRDNRAKQNKMHN